MKVKGCHTLHLAGGAERGWGVREGMQKVASGGVCVYVLRVILAQNMCVCVCFGPFSAGLWTSVHNAAQRPFALF